MNLVTGSNGFLGAAVVERLLAHGETRIRCFVRPGSDRSRLQRVQEKHPAVPLEIFEGSLSSVAGASAALQNIHTVYHVAAGKSGSAADLFLSSVVASKNLLEAVAACGHPSKIVLVSSFGVYGTSGLPKGATLTENTPLETQPEKRDLYSYSKWRQEKLFWEYREKHNLSLVVVRPGVIYGPGDPSASGLSNRIGLSIGGVFLHLGGANRLPLSYVDNCAEAIVLAGTNQQAEGLAVNVHDDDLPTCGQFLRHYRKNVAPLRVVPVPYGATVLLSRLLEHWHVRSRGQIPAVFTPYKTRASWKGTRFSNARLKEWGWQQIVSTSDGLKRTAAAKAIQRVKGTDVCL